MDLLQGGAAPRRRRRSPRPTSSTGSPAGAAGHDRVARRARGRHGRRRADQRHGDDRDGRPRAGRPRRRHRPAVNELADLDAAARDLLAQAETLDELAGQAERRAGRRPGRPRRGGAPAGGRGDAGRPRRPAAAGRRRRGAGRRRAPGGAGRAGRGGGRDRPTPPRRSRRSAAATASAPAPAAAPPLSRAEKLALAQQVAANPKLRQIAALAGRLHAHRHAGPGHPRRPPARRGDVDHRRRRPGPRPAGRAGAARRPGDGGPLLRPARREAAAPVRARRPRAAGQGADHPGHRQQRLDGRREGVLGQGGGAGAAGDRRQAAARPGRPPLRRRRPRSCGSSASRAARPAPPTCSPAPRSSSAAAPCFEPGCGRPCG